MLIAAPSAEPAQASRMECTEAKRFRNSCSVLVLITVLAIHAGCSGEKNESPDSTAVSPTEQNVSPETNVRVDRVAQAKMAAKRGDLAAAEKLLMEQLIERPEDSAAMMLAGDLLSQAGNFAEAIRWYEKTMQTDSDPPLAAWDQLAQAWMRVGSPFDSVEVLQDAVRRFPDRPEPRFDLAGLAAMLGLESPTVASLQWLTQHGNGHPEGYVLLAHPTRLEPDPQVCQSALKKRPQDRRAEYGLARLEAQSQQWNSVAKRLRPVLEKHPEFVAASCLYGRAIVELDDVASVQAWQATLPDGIESTAEYWEVAGYWSLHRGNKEAAAKSFWKAVLRDQGGNDRTLVQLSNALRAIDQGDEADLIAGHAKKVAALSDATSTFFERGSRSQSAAMTVANRMVDLGRLWEAEGWARWAVQLAEEPYPNAQQRYAEIRRLLSPQTPWKIDRGRIAESIDLASLPNVVWNTGTDKSRSDISIAEETRERRLQLVDRASVLGMNHTCELAPRTADVGMWIYQSVGGGLAVLDLDLDGWPDLTAANLDGSPLATDSKSNPLFRNLSGRFEDVSVASGLNDQGFSQGIAVGDFNSDGFPDIYDANIGQNRLMLNNGDGTFTDVTDSVGINVHPKMETDWTASVVIADLDGDGHADLFDVNYCDGSQPYEKECRVKQTGQLASCTPLDFRARQDRVWRGNGDGTFSDATDEWMSDNEPGRGLGLIVGNLDRLPGLDVYVANDMTGNHFWSADRSDGRFKLTELATLRGLAVNHRSVSQASMGMAAGDPDRDGDIDFFVTHFSDDHNTYYEQISENIWQDRSYPSGLAEPSESLLGFGTEWIDFDNDSTPELIVTNGHVSDLRHAGQSFEMPAQVFERQANGKWQLMDSDRLGGGYFDSGHLGRALVSLDVNRDGKVDTAISHIFEPVSLLINETATAGNSVGLILVATESHRDAIGTIIEATIGDRVQTFQLTGGDGYMCSNQRRISIGLGSESVAKKLTIQWPSGKEQTLADPTAMGDYLIIEGAPTAYPLRPNQ